MQSSVFLFYRKNDSILEPFANSTLWVMMYQRDIVTYIGSLNWTVGHDMTKNKVMISEVY